MAAVIDHSRAPVEQPRVPVAGRARRARGARPRPNLLGGLGGWLWLVVIVVPIYYIVIGSFKSQTGYFDSNPLLPTPEPTLENYATVLDNGFFRYLANSAVVTAGAVVPAVLLAFMAAYPIVRSRSRVAGLTNSMFLMGLALPLQATIVPIYLIIGELGLYDTLLGLVLPAIAFALPVTVLILSNFMRDIPRELFESMYVDGATNWTILWRLVLPMTRPALTTVAIYNALGVWNGFLFPLILTQSDEQRVLPLSLWSFQGEYSVNVPAILASVVLSTLPLVVVYVIGRRQLVSGLTAGFSR
jgi:raffinose/stachyose/melibiose transport system permease protein